MKTWKTEIRTIEDSCGIVIPRELLREFNLSVGDPVRLFKVEDGILLTSSDSHFARAMEVYQESAEAYRNALRKLAE